jgi:hypothetical protein
MKRGISLLALALLAGVAGSTASAAVLTFDNISNVTSGVAIPNGYGGLNWSNFGVVSSVWEQTNFGLNGYTYGVVSGPNVAYNMNANEAIASDGLFTFNSAYFTGAWNDGLNVTVRGYQNSVLVGQTTFVVNSTAPTLETFNWTVDKLTFDSSGGTPHGYTGGSGEHFVMDSMTINEPISSVPLPAAAVPGMALLAGLGVVRKLRSRRSV